MCRSGGFDWLDLIRLDPPNSPNQTALIDRTKRHAPFDIATMQ
jgi:hypothetical protein